MGMYRLVWADKENIQNYIDIKKAFSHKICDFNPILGWKKRNEYQ